MLKHSCIFFLSVCIGEVNDNDGDVTTMIVTIMLTEMAVTPLTLIRYKYDDGNIVINTATTIITTTLMVMMVIVILFTMM